MTVDGRPRSSASPLAAACAALVVYASLYPFTPWRWPPGQALSQLLALPASRHHIAFDLWANGLGYMPLGLLLAIALRRRGAGAAQAGLVAAATAALLSYGCEVLQQFIPGRVPSLEDWLLNAAGAAFGAACALALQRLGFIDRWQAFRVRWFSGDAAFALAMLALWPLALMFPTPVPLGLGQVGTRLRTTLAELLADVPWAEDVYQLLAEPVLPSALGPLTEVLLVAAGLMGPVLVAYAVVGRGWRRVTTAVGALVVACAALALSTVLNFGPVHALSWITPRTVQGLALGLGLTLLALPLPRRAAAGLGLVVLTLLVAGVSHAPDDPYFEQSLQRWEQGRFVRFHGLGQWLGWLWPYAAMGWLLSRVARRGPPPGEAPDSELR